MYIYIIYIYTSKNKQVKTPIKSQTSSLSLLHSERIAPPFSSAGCSIDTHEQFSEVHDSNSEPFDQMAHEALVTTPECWNKVWVIPRDGGRVSHHTGKTTTVRWNKIGQLKSCQDNKTRMNNIHEDSPNILLFRTVNHRYPSWNEWSRRPLDLWNKSPKGHATCTYKQHKTKQDAQQWTHIFTRIVWKAVDFDSWNPVGHDNPAVVIIWMTIGKVKLIILMPCWRKSQLMPT